MNRRALQSLFRNLVLAALPLAGCSEDALPQSAGDAGCMPVAPFDMMEVLPDATFYRLVDGGYPLGKVADQTLCQRACPGTYGCAVVEIICGQFVLACAHYAGMGRLPAGLQRPLSAPPLTPLRAYWSSVARLEAASVFAFRALEVELRAHGAPASLVAEAARSAADEERHARVTAGLARRAGAPVAPVVVLTPEPRSLAAIARENAVEGCARETWGAVLARYQAHAATDIVVRRALGPIARDEARHAALAWAVAGWAEPLLSRVERAGVEAARRDAFNELRSAANVPAGAEIRASIGLPEVPAARKLVAGLVAALG